MPAKRKYQSDEDNAKFIAWHRARAQARFRNEPWELTSDEWVELWTPDKWRRRGRANQDLCLMRVVTTLPWSKSNVKIVTRLEQLGNRETMTPWWQTQYDKYCR